MGRTKKTGSVARQLDIEQRLIGWADWNRSGAGSSAGGEPTAHADEWLWDGAQAIDHYVAALPGKLPATLEEVYVRAGNMARHALRLGCPEDTLVRRIGRAHALLAAQLHPCGQACRLPTDAQHVMPALHGNAEASESAGRVGARLNTKET